MILHPRAFRNLCRARDLLREPTDDTPTIERVARDVGLSPFHFIRQFEALFGATPHQFRIQHRLDRAKELLASGRCSVTEVCMEVGWSSLGSFSALFTRRVGEPPSAYRRRARALLQVPAWITRPPVPGCLGRMTLLPPGAFRSFREA